MAEQAAARGPCPGVSAGSLSIWASSRGGEVLLLARAAIDRPPDDQPDEDDGAGERGRPRASRTRWTRTGRDQRRQDRADIGAGVEDADREGALLLRKPLGDRLHAGGEIARFAEAQGEAGDHEDAWRCWPRRAPWRRCPRWRGERIAEARAEFVDHPPEDEVADRVGELEGEDDVGVGGLVPAIFGLQRRLEDADHLPVDIVDRGGEEEQRANAPAHAADTRLDRSPPGQRRRLGHPLPLPHRGSRPAFSGFVWETGVIYNPVGATGERYADEDRRWWRSASLRAGNRRPTAARPAANGQAEASALGARTGSPRPARSMCRSAQVPAAVLAAARTARPGFVPAEAQSETRDGRLYYRCRGAADRRRRDRVRHHGGRRPLARGRDPARPRASPPCRRRSAPPRSRMTPRWRRPG